MSHSFISRNFHYATFRGEIAFKDNQSAGGLERIGQRPHYFLSGRFVRHLSGLGDRLAGHCHGIGMNEVAVHQSLGDELNATGFVQIVCDKTAARFEIRDERSARADPIEIVDGQLDAGFARDSQQVQHRIGGAARRGHRCDRVLDRFAGENLGRPEIAAQKIDHQFAGVERGVFFFRYGRGNTVTAHRRDTEKLQDRRHRIGGELTAARPRTRASRVFDGFKLFRVNSAAAVGADGLKNVLNS